MSLFRKGSIYQSNLNHLTSIPYYEEYQTFKKDAKDIANKEVFLAPMINEVVLSHDTFAEAISTLLANSFESNFIPRASWYNILLPIYQGEYGFYEGEDLISLFLQDLTAVQERDPACTNLVQVFLFFKGFKSLQANRAAHVLWENSRKDMAYSIQSRVSELWAVDIHPGAKIGGGLMIDHGTGIVIGETAIIGKNCSFLHGVTLGSTGKDVGDRHPKIGDDVLIGCGAIVLGNITVGNSSKIGSGSVVIKPIPENVTAVGNPAKIVGKTVTKSAAKDMDLALKDVISTSGISYNQTWSSWADGSLAFSDIDACGKGQINKDDLRAVFKMKFGCCIADCNIDAIFSILDENKDGKICHSDFEKNFTLIQPLLNVTISDIITKSTKPSRFPTPAMHATRKASVATASEVDVSLPPIAVNVKPVQARRASMDMNSINLEAIEDQGIDGLVVEYLKNLDISFLENI